MKNILTLSLVVYSSITGAQEYSLIDKEQWVKAAQTGTVKILKKGIKQGLNLELEDTSGHTALHYAVHYGHYTAVLLLLKAGSAINALDKDLCTALHYAAQNNNKHIMQLLLKAKASINAQNHFGNTPLAAAVNKGHERIVQILLAQGANIYLKNINNETVLDTAQTLKDSSITQTLTRCHKIYTYKSLVFKATADQDSNSLRQMAPFITMSLKESITGNNPLHKAVTQRNKQLIIMLIVYNPDLLFTKNSKGFTPLDNILQDSALLQLIVKIYNI